MSGREQYLALRLFGGMPVVDHLIVYSDFPPSQNRLLESQPADVSHYKQRCFGEFTERQILLY